MQEPFYTCTHIYDAHSFPVNFIQKKKLESQIVFWFWSTDPNRSYVPSAVGDKTRCWCIKSFYGDTSEAPNIFMSSLLL